MRLLLGLLVALLVVFACDGPSANGAPGQRAERNEVVGAATIEQATDAPDPFHRIDASVPFAESDDGDCDEDTSAASQFSLNACCPTWKLELALPSGICRSPGHRSGTEKPPRV